MEVKSGQPWREHRREFTLFGLFVLGHVEVAEQADERREDATGFRAEHGVNARANVARGWLGHAGEPR